MPTQAACGSTFWLFNLPFMTLRFMEVQTEAETADNTDTLVFVLSGAAGD